MQGNRQATTDWAVEGALVAFPAAGGRKPRMLDGFYRPAPKKNAPLLAFVHGMGSNFYRSALKKAFLEAASQTCKQPYVIQGYPFSSLLHGLKVPALRHIRNRA